MMDIRRPGATIVIVALFGSVRLFAQAAPTAPVVRPPAAATMAAAAADTGTRAVKVMVGRSAVLDVGSGPEGVTAGPKSIWVANGISTDLTRIDPRVEP